MSNQRPNRRAMLNKQIKNVVFPRPNRTGGNPTNTPDTLDSSGPRDASDSLDAEGNGIVPVAGLSIFDPVFMGTDETGRRVEVTLPYRNLLMGGEPGSGKSVALNNVVAHCALCTDVQMWGFEGKRVELGLWRAIMDRFVGNDPFEAIAGLTELQAVMDDRYDYLDSVGRRKITPADITNKMPFIACVIDEIAYYSATAGDKRSQEEFAIRLRDIVARGRAAGIIAIGATQRPSADIIPPSLRDIWGYRCAFRCTNDSSSDIILGPGWAKQGYSARTIAPEDRGVGWLLAEGGIPRRFKAAYLSDAHIETLVGRAAWIRGLHNNGNDSGPA
ncbi:MAG: FtsK/SpoIIIE domain-containing protein, partial [Stackebrandtia sp.]